MPDSVPRRTVIGSVRERYQKRLHTLPHGSTVLANANADARKGEQMEPDWATLASPHRAVTATTLAEFYELNRALTEDGLVSNAVAAYRRAWRLRLDPSLGSVPLIDLDPLTIARARALWDGKPSTKQDALALLSKVLDLAVLANLIPTNAARSLPRSRHKAEDADPVARALSDRQVARMLELTSFHPFGQRALAGLTFTGLRLGELTGLRWEDLDEERGIITVRRTFSPNGHGKLEARATKSGRIRSVPIIEDLRPWLDAAREAGFPFVFTGVRGGPLDSGNLARAVKWFALRDRIVTFSDGRPLRFHDLRHTYLTRLARLGIPPAQLQRIAGHASITTTELYTRSSSIEAALAVKQTVDRLSREVTLGGGESAANNGFTRDSSW
ncbi:MULTISPECIES: site-specific integrase [unclassified Salinibacterium]|uniref:tyrosine-type recombinase/integrase n=1 Tax=unclassified Salinibacterium TaxID=2632331 RepID=UPI00143D7A72|nr:MULTISPECIES: site-specific integrase [unclassified Salinibacterium]